MKIFTGKNEAAVLPKPPQELRVFGRVEIEEELAALPGLVEANIPNSIIHSHGQISERKPFIEPDDKERLVTSFGHRIEELCSLLNPDSCMSNSQLNFVISSLLDWAGSALKDKKYYLSSDSQRLISVATFINTCRP